MEQELIKPDVRDFDTGEKYDFNNYIEACRWILKNHQCLKIDGTLIDVQSANATILVYDSLSKDNQEKVLFLPVVKFIKFAWKQVKTK